VTRGQGCTRGGGLLATTNLFWRQRHKLSRIDQNAAPWAALPVKTPASLDATFHLTCTRRGARSSPPCEHSGVALRKTRRGGLAGVASRAASSATLAQHCHTTSAPRRAFYYLQTLPAPAACLHFTATTGCGVTPALRAASISPRRKILPPRDGRDSLRCWRQADTGSAGSVRNRHSRWCISTCHGRRRALRAAHARAYRHAARTAHLFHLYHHSLPFSPCLLRAAAPPPALPTCPTTCHTWHCPLPATTLPPAFFLPPWHFTSCLCPQLQLPSHTCYFLLPTFCLLCLCCREGRKRAGGAPLPACCLPTCHFAPAASLTSSHPSPPHASTRSGLIAPHRAFMAEQGRHSRRHSRRLGAALAARRPQNTAATTLRDVALHYRSLGVPPSAMPSAASLTSVHAIPVPLLSHADLLPAWNDGHDAVTACAARASRGRLKQQANGAAGKAADWQACDGAVVWHSAAPAPYAPTWRHSLLRSWRRTTAEEEEAYARRRRGGAAVASRRSLLFSVADENAHFIAWRRKAARCILRPLLTPSL